MEWVCSRTCYLSFGRVPTGPRHLKGKCRRWQAIQCEFVCQKRVVLSRRLDAIWNACRGLASALDFLLTSAGGHSIELLRKEAISSLPAEAATQILQHSYYAIVPVTGLRGPPLSIPLGEGKNGATDARVYVMRLTHSVLPFCSSIQLWRDWWCSHTVAASCGV